MLVVLLLLAFASLGEALPRLDSLKKHFSWKSYITTDPRLTVTQDMIDEFNYFSEYAAAAYCINGALDPGRTLYCMRDGVNLCPTLSSNNAVSFRYMKGVAAIQGFVAVDTVKETIVLSFQGCNNIKTWMISILFSMPVAFSDLCGDCKTHYGFRRTWHDMGPKALQAVADARRQWPHYRVVATGHSYGAALATIATIYLRRPLQPPEPQRLAGLPDDVLVAFNDTLPGRCDLFTYGSPRVGNEHVAKLASAAIGRGQTYRVTHMDDPVPRLPTLSMGYRHASPEYWLSPVKARKTEADEAAQDKADQEGGGAAKPKPQVMVVDTPKQSGGRWWNPFTSTWFNKLWIWPWGSSKPEVETSTGPFTPADFKTCAGIANVNCSAGVTWWPWPVGGSSHEGRDWIDRAAHRTYFRRISRCSPFGWRVLRDEKNLLERELEEMRALVANETGLVPRVDSGMGWLVGRGETDDIDLSRWESLSDEEIVSKLNDMAMEDVEFGARLDQGS